MKRILSVLCAAATMAAAGVATPAVAAPLRATPSYSASTAMNVTNVDWRHRRGFAQRRGFVSDADRMRGIPRGYNHHYRGWRGHRGHGRYYYRNHHNDFVGPAAGFVAGALIGGLVTNSIQSHGGGGSHAQWCYNHYRSYRASDNTFQPYHGPRRQCNSPYN